jgi:Protein of unknown function (DUF1153)
MGERLRKARAARSEPAVPEVRELPERWSAQRKAELVLRLLRGEALDAVSRDSRMPAHELESWNRLILEHGRRGLKIRGEHPAHGRSAQQGQRWRLCLRVTGGMVRRGDAVRLE